MKGWRALLVEAVLRCELEKRNPAGRPKGSKDKKTLVAQEFEKEGSVVAAVVIEKAKGGDMTAANIVLQRISPPLKSRAEKVKFELDSQAPLTDQARQVLAAMALGEIDPDTAQVVINCISAFAGRGRWMNWMSACVRWKERHNEQAPSLPMRPLPCAC